MGSHHVPRVIGQTRRVEGGFGARTQRGCSPRRRVFCEGHLSLRPVTMATCCAQCRGEGGAGAMATQAVTATARVGEGRGGEESFLKETGAPL